MSLRIFVTLSILLAAMPAGADIYKYTDENGVVNYTNMPARMPAKAERIATEPAPSAVTPAPASGSASPARVQRATAPTPAGFPRVDSDTQRKRDDSRRQILETEFLTEQKALEESRQALTSGQEARQGNERGLQKYLDRVKDLQDAVDTHQANLEALQKEIGNLH